MSTKIEWVKNPDGLQGVTWNPVPDFPGYFASKEGLVKSTLREKCKILKPIISHDGHHYVFLYKSGKQHKVWIHRAILSSFVGPCPPRYESRHLNGNPSDNKLSNLSWGTKLENMKDKQIHGTQPRGENHGSAKLTESDVMEIKEKIGSVTIRELGRQYGVSHTAIRRAALGIKWRHLNG